MDLLHAVLFVFIAVFAILAFHYYDEYNKAKAVPQKEVFALPEDIKPRAETTFNHGYGDYSEFVVRAKYHGASARVGQRGEGRIYIHTSPNKVMSVDQREAQSLIQALIAANKALAITKMEVSSTTSTEGV